MIKHIIAPVLLFSFTLLFCWGCNTDSGPQEQKAAFAKQEYVQLSVTAATETKSNPDAAQSTSGADVAIWYNSADPEGSLILGTNQAGGVKTYTIRGDEGPFYAGGQPRSIDVIQDVILREDTMDLVAWTNGADQSVDLYRIGRDGRLKDVAVNALAMDTSALHEVSWLCFYYGSAPFLFVSGTSGHVMQFELKAPGNGQIGLSFVRELFFDSETSGMVADPDHGFLYVAEREKGIWRMHAEPHSGDERTLLALSDASNPRIAFPIEGLAIYERGDQGYLIASSMGNYAYTVFSRTGNNKYIGSFKIVDSPTCDGVEKSRGIDVISVSLGEKWPYGVFIAHDGRNAEAGAQGQQNFKIIPWEKIDALFTVAQ